MAPKAPKPKNGRPPSPYPDRLPVRHTPDQRAEWSAAAASCGLPLQDWIRATLAHEAKRATHVPMVKRDGRRG